MIIETFGSTIKEESVKTFERDILENTLVLENEGRYPGYYGRNVPDDGMPDSLFFVITDKEPTEKILRMTHIINTEKSLFFDGTPSTIGIKNVVYNAIRVRGLTSFEQIAPLQVFYRELGINYMKPRNINETGIITVKKLFRINAIDNNIYRDSNPYKYYLKIDKYLDWETFKKLTIQVRSNVTTLAFDAALAVVYAAQVMDLIRVYTKELNIDELKHIHCKYNELIKKLDI